MANGWLYKAAILDFEVILGIYLYILQVTSKCIKN